ncbi:MAG: glutamyl-tRNA reductase [Candidatus Marinimicrobia bacterium]|nr:glutamyl-tRNA reductase [Candidatus Neomarinimicrobiota bacterium]
MSPVNQTSINNRTDKSSLSSLHFIGINHRRCGLDIRSRYALSTSQMDQLLAALRLVEDLRGCLILSTCNRTEFIFDGGAVDQVRDIIRAGYGEDEATFRRHFHDLVGWEVVKHLFKLASGLGSMILGETQIVGQIKQSVKMSQEANCFSPLLAKLCHGAFKTGKRVRHETQLATGAASISTTALMMARESFPQLADCSVLVIGAGDMGRDVVYNLREKGLSRITVMNRTRDKGERFAQAIGGTFKPLDELAGEIAEHDIIITCTSAGEVLIDADMLGAGRDRPLLFLDLAVPANVAAQVTQAPQVKRIDLDTIQAHIDTRTVAREHEVPEAEAIVSEELIAFQYKQIMDFASPAIVQLREEYEHIRQDELNRLSGEGLDQLRPLLDTLSQRLVKRLAVRPLQIFRQQAEADTLAMEKILDAASDHADQ